MGKRDSHRTGGGGAKRARFTEASRNLPGPALPIGRQGIIVTLEGGDIRKASREVLNVLGDIWEKIATESLGPDGKARDSHKGGAGAVDADVVDTDFANAIAAEVKDIKDQKKQPFVVLDTGIKTCMFVLMPLKDGPGPREVVARLLQDAATEKVLQFRFCARFIPVTHTCKPDLESIKAASKMMVDASPDCCPTAESQSVAVLYEHRAAPKALNRPDVIDAAIDAVARPPHTVKLRGASKTLAVQVIRNACGLAILDDYHLMGKYNVKTLCGDDWDKEKVQEELAKQTVKVQERAGSESCHAASAGTDSGAGPLMTGEGDKLAEGSATEKVVLAKEGIEKVESAQAETSPG